ncbi:hypothetical protein [Mycobacterium sp.]|uniref:hypothetical protein n=1 Tax=Mycobacterium sp. TaxID=1785 RepID=UPI003F964881
MELVRALHHQLREMTKRLAWVEREHVTHSHGRACAMRLEAVRLRRDIAEAQVHIDRLQRRYLSGDERTQQSGPHYRVALAQEFRKPWR